MTNAQPRAYEIYMNLDNALRSVESAIKEGMPTSSAGYTTVVHNALCDAKVDACNILLILARPRRYNALHDILQSIRSLRIHISNRATDKPYKVFADFGARLESAEEQLRSALDAYDSWLELTD